MEKKEWLSETETDNAIKRSHNQKNDVNFINSVNFTTVLLSYGSTSHTREKSENVFVKQSNDKRNI